MDVLIRGWGVFLGGLAGPIYVMRNNMSAEELNPIPRV